AVVALTTVEICSLHFNVGKDHLDSGRIAGTALFGDAAASVLLKACDDAVGPELVDAYCAADFRTSDQMTWKITDEGFAMGLSSRIPITLRRNVAGVVDRLLAPHGLTRTDIAHWLVHPGGPDVLDSVSSALELGDEQLAISWQVLRDHG